MIQNYALVSFSISILNGKLQWRHLNSNLIRYNYIFCSRPVIFHEKSNIHVQIIKLFKSHLFDVDLLQNNGKISLNEQSRFRKHVSTKLKSKKKYCHITYRLEINLLNWKKKNLCKSSKSCYEIKPDIFTEFHHFASYDSWMNRGCDRKKTFFFNSHLFNTANSVSSPNIYISTRAGHTITHISSHPHHLQTRRDYDHTINKLLNWFNDILFD